MTKLTTGPVNLKNIPNYLQFNRVKRDINGWQKTLMSKRLLPVLPFAELNISLRSHFHLLVTLNFESL